MIGTYILIVRVELVYYITAKTNLILKIPGFCAWTNNEPKKVKIIRNKKKILYRAIIASVQ